MIYPPNQKPPIWNIDPGIIAYNCQRAGMPHPVLAMPMWEGAGDWTSDLSGQENHGALNGPEWVADGLDFNGSSDYINVKAMPTMTQWSLVSHVIINVNEVNQNFVSNDRGGWNDDVLFGVTPDSVAVGNVIRRFGITHQDSTSEIRTIVNDDTDVVVGKEYLVIATSDGESLKLYVDGILKGTTAKQGTALIFDSAITTLGKDPNVGRYLNGILKNSTIYNTALTAAQGKFLYENLYFMYQIPEELYGYVATVDGWTGEIISVTNPSEILGKATSGISEVNGI